MKNETQNSIHCLDQSENFKDFRFERNINNYCFFDEEADEMRYVDITIEVLILIAIFFMYRKAKRNLRNFKKVQYGAGEWENPTYCIISYLQV